VHKLYVFLNIRRAGEKLKEDITFHHLNAETEQTIEDVSQDRSV
jgi:hypothetical protein